MKFLKGTIIKKFYPTLVVKSIFYLIEFVLYYLHKFNFIKHGSIKMFNFLYLKPSLKIGIDIRKKQQKLNINTKSDKKINNKLNKLYEYGYTKLGTLNNKTVKNALKFFNSKKIYNAHNKTFSDKKKYNIKDFKNLKIKFKNNYASMSSKDTISFLEKERILNKLNLKKILLGYFDKKKSHIFSAETIISRKSLVPFKNLQTFHRDYESIKSLVIFIYWTGTSEKNGSTQVIKKSHKLEFEKCVTKKFIKKNLITLSSKPGDAFLMDPLTIHRGSPKIKNLRIATWIRISFYPSIMYYLSDQYKEINSYNRINNSLKKILS